MDGWIQGIEIFALVTGVLYVVLEIGQKNAMWWIGIATGAACAFSFGAQRLYASMGLNVYYVGMSVWGLIRWRRDRLALQAAEHGDATVHLRRLTRPVMLGSAAVFVAGALALIALLRWLGDSESALDAIVTVLSAVGTWWLAQAYPEQWMVWIVADVLSCVLCAVAGMPWMAALYLVYALSAVYGWVHWMKNGKYIDT